MTAPRVVTPTSPPPHRDRIAEHRARIALIARLTRENDLTGLRVLRGFDVGRVPKVKASGPRSAWPRREGTRQ